MSELNMYQGTSLFQNVSEKKSLPLLHIVRGGKTYLVCSLIGHPVGVKSKILNQGLFKRNYSYQF